MSLTIPTPAPPRPGATLPATAAALLATLRPLGPSVEATGLVLTRDPPAALVPILAVLHSGVRALLAGRPWYGCGSDRRTAAPRALDPAAPIPAGVTLLAVEGDVRWDRIDPAARLNLPALFVGGFGNTPYTVERPMHAGYLREFAGPSRGT